ncbi:hypothetical protein [Staphylococcus aureus]|uniref:hypothetical protein n=1 Tax=Staphylococcus aureus TaxID=1280 RepID=UPI003B3A9A49
MNDQNSLRTYLIIDKSDLEIMGYFFLKIVNIKLEKDVNGKTKKEKSRLMLKRMENFKHY